MTREELTKKHEDEIRNFNFGYAYSDEQYKYMLEGWGLSDDSTVIDLGNGRYVQEKDLNAMHEILNRQAQERLEATAYEDNK